MMAVIGHSRHVIRRANHRALLPIGDAPCPGDMSASGSRCCMCFRNAHQNAGKKLAKIRVKKALTYAKMCFKKQAKMFVEKSRKSALKTGMEHCDFFQCTFRHVGSVFVK